MFNSFMNLFLGCSHKNTTFPLTTNRNSPGLSAYKNRNRHNTYVVCLDCGRELDYDWTEMRVGKPVTARGSAAAAAESYSQ
jgi:hypothetical protein